MKGLQGLQGCPSEDGDGECPNKLQQTTVGDRLQNLSNLGIKYNLPQIFLELILPRLSLLLPGAPMSTFTSHSPSTLLFGPASQASESFLSQDKI